MLAASSPADREFLTNRAIGWLSLAIGVGIGLIMGLWSFDGPLATPAWLGEYNETSRRLARLGHIACLGLGILNILVASELARLQFSTGVKRTAAVAMNLGNVLLPVSLFAAAFYHPLKYTMPLPALAVFLALVIMAYGVWSRRGSFHADQ